MKSASSGAPTPTKNGKQEEKYSQRLYQSQLHNSNGKGNKCIDSKQEIFINQYFVDFSRIDNQNVTPYVSVMYPLSPNLELDMEEDEKDIEDDDDMLGKHSVGMTSTRLQASSYNEKSEHIKALSS